MMEKSAVVCSKRNKILILVTLMALVLGVVCPQRPVSALSDEQRGAISQNCATIKQSLEQLQRADSRTRTYLGTTYETLANKFIIPLNLRLVKNNLPTLSIQADFTLGQTSFKDSYTDYMKSFGELLGVDCKTDPEDFYQKLEVTRTKREILHNNVQNLNQLVNKQYQSVQILRGGIK